MTAFFDADPAGYAAKYEARTSEGHSFRSRRGSLLRLLGRGPGRVLDIGCGPGVMTQAIGGQTWDYWGVDLSSPMIALARKRFANQPGISFEVGAVTQIPAPDQFFDAVVAMGLMEYVNDESAALREIRRVLKPGGIFIVSVPNWWSPARILDRSILTPLARLYRLITGRGPSPPRAGSSVS